MAVPERFRLLDVADVVDLAGDADAEVHGAGSVPPAASDAPARSEPEERVPADAASARRCDASACCRPIRSRVEGIPGDARALLVDGQSALAVVGCVSRRLRFTERRRKSLASDPLGPLHSEPDWAGRRRQAVGLELVSSRANILLIQNVETQDSGRMRRMVSVVTRVVALVVCVPGLASFGGGLAQAATPPDFESEVLPVLKSRCFACHGPLRQRGSLRLDSRPAMLIGGGRGAAIVPG
ncbi:MAG: hypothetical protein F4Z19_17315, partial [Holophagales bacterium]|nr:hypothetical protein [Holophagales bacterium]